MSSTPSDALRLRVLVYEKGGARRGVNVGRKVDAGCGFTNAMRRRRNELYIWDDLCVGARR